MKKFILGMLVMHSLVFGYSVMSKNSFPSDHLVSYGIKCNNGSVITINHYTNNNSYAVGSSWFNSFNEALNYGCGE